MAQKEDIVIAFDLYGTLLSTESISNRLAEITKSPEKGTQLAATWRKYQLEYTWRLTCMGYYEDFYNVTRNALIHALSEAAVSLDEESLDQLMSEYDHLSTFPDVTPALQNLSSAKANIKAVIFSNGTQKMVSNSVFRSASLSPHAALFSDLLTIDGIRKYKPARETYQHLAESTGMSKSMDKIWLISGNPFDIVGATHCGIKAAWLDRGGKGWEDSAAPSLRPRIVGRSLDEVINAILGELGE